MISLSTICGVCYRQHKFCGIFMLPLLTYPLVRYGQSARHRIIDRVTLSSRPKFRHIFVLKIPPTKVKPATYAATTTSQIGSFYHARRHRNRDALVIPVTCWRSVYARLYLYAHFIKPIGCLIYSYFVNIVGFINRNNYLIETTIVKSLLTGENPHLRENLRKKHLLASSSSSFAHKQVPKRTRLILPLAIQISKTCVPNSKWPT